MFSLLLCAALAKQDQVEKIPVERAKILPIRDSDNEVQESREEDVDLHDDRSFKVVDSSNGMIVKRNERYVDFDEDVKDEGEANFSVLGTILITGALLAAAAAGTGTTVSAVTPTQHPDRGGC